MNAAAGTGIPRSTKRMSKPMSTPVAATPLAPDPNSSRRFMVFPREHPMCHAPTPRSVVAVCQRVVKVHHHEPSSSYYGRMVEQRPELSRTLAQVALERARVLAPFVLFA